MLSTRAPAQVAQSVEQWTENPFQSAALSLSPEVLARFWSKVDKDSGPIHPALGRCWVWTGATGDYGYGRFAQAGQAAEYRAAHRVGYEIQAGPIPAGLDLDHLCRNRPCVRVSHLEPVTRRENLVRGVGNHGAPNKPDRALAPVPVGAEFALSAVAAESGFSVDELRGFGRRHGPLRDARREVARRLRTSGWSYREIGAALGGRDHATIICALRHVVAGAAVSQ